MIEKYFRKNILALRAYSAARTEESEGATLLLDANESPYPGKWNRYPDPVQTELRQALADAESLEWAQVIVGNGSDELIDLIVRSTCTPGEDSITVFSPGYGMYAVTADICGVDTLSIPLDEDFRMDFEAWDESGGRESRVVFICSPNNPSGNDIPQAAIRRILREAKGLVVVDEAYIEYSQQESVASWVNEFPNLIVIRTFSKAFGLAALRVGVGFANTELISILGKVKPPYNVNAFSQQEALQALKQREFVQTRVAEVKVQRQMLADWLRACALFRKVYPSSANFILTECQQPEGVYQGLLASGIKIRMLRQGERTFLRFSVGTPEQNEELIQALKTLSNETSTVY